MREYFLILPRSIHHLWRQRKKQLRENKFFLGIVKLIFGSGIAQIITLLLSPIITRLYAPEVLGIFGVFLAIIAILSVVATLRYELAIVLPENDDDAQNLVVLNVVLSIIVFFVLLFACFIVLHQSESTFIGSRVASLGSYIIIIPFGVLLTSILGIVRAWLNRQQAYMDLAKLDVLRSGLLNGLQIVIGTIAPFGVLGLLASRMISDLGFIIVGVRDSDLRKLTKSSVNIQFDTLKQLLYEYKKFPIYTFPSALLNNLNRELPLIMLFALFDPVVAGYFTLATRILSRPVDFIGAAVKDVFYREYVLQQQQGKNVLKLMVRTLLILLIIIGLPVLFLSIFAPTFIGFVFGEDWVGAGVYVRILGPVIVFQLIATATGLSMYAMGHQKVILIWTVCYTSLAALALYTGESRGAVFSVGLFSAVSTLAFIILIGMNLYLAANTNAAKAQNF